MCFRQEQGKCAICFQPVITASIAVIDQASFGLSLSPAGIAAGTQDTSCTQQRPFRVHFKTDADEVTLATAANMNDQGVHPGGIIGFHLNYALQDC
ncbi:hypothetical protein TCAL_16298, partial [Tigriopus californicus]